MDFHCCTKIIRKITCEFHTSQVILLSYFLNFSRKAFNGAVSINPLGHIAYLMSDDEFQKYNSIAYRVNGSGDAAVYLEKKVY